MKLSLRGEYALRALIALGANNQPGVVRMQAIADEERIPKRFLGQILNDLRAGGFVESKRGIAGGYRLASPPENISLAAVVRHLEGGLIPVAEAAGPAGRPGRVQMNESQLAIRSVLKEVHEAMLSVLEHVTLADLCERARQQSLTTEGGEDFMI